MKTQDELADYVAAVFTGNTAYAPWKLTALMINFYNETRREAFKEAARAATDWIALNGKAPTELLEVGATILALSPPPPDAAKE